MHCGKVHRHPTYGKLLQTIANYCTCLWLQRRRRGSGRRAIMQEYLLGMHGSACSRRAPLWSKLVQSLTPVARRGWLAPLAAECHTYILTVNGHKAGSVACNAAARGPSHGTEDWGRWPGAVRRHPKYGKLLQTIANYCTCLWTQRRRRSSGRRAIMREYLLGMHGCACSRRAPRCSKLVQSLTPVTRRGWHAPLAAKCHTYILTVNGHKASSVACNAAARGPSLGTDHWGRWPGAVHRRPKYCKLLRTIANYCTCL